MKQIVKPLCDWYQQNGRLLPWRIDQNPYHIWISEVMLQQTRVEAVKMYYERFMEQLPDVESLAHVREEKLLKLWQGLGYYSRAKNLKKAALQIVESGMPTTYEEILKLPGIGSYTAGAIASIAFNQKVPAIDGNVLRVMMRLKNCHQDIRKNQTQKELFQEMMMIMPNHPGNFNQALMDLGAMICVPNGEPKCSICPLQSYCLAYKKHTQMKLPVKGEKVKKKIEEYTVFLLCHDQKIAIQKRSETGLLSSLYAFPNCNCKMTKQEAFCYLKENGYMVSKLIEGGTVKHIFTHKIWKMNVFICFVDQINQNLWVTQDMLRKKYAMPTAFLKVLTLLKNVEKK